MRRMHVLYIMLVAIALALPAQAAGAVAPAMPFQASVTEEFCGPGVTCGTAVTRLGHATVVTEITGFVPLPSGCFGDTHTSTLTFEDTSTLVLAVAGELCPTPTGFRFTGAYTVDTGASTGRFSGASGSGSVQAFRASGPIHATFRGQLSLTP